VATSDWLRPYGLIIGGVLEQGLELLIDEGVVYDIRPSSKPPEPFILSPAFVNAHSHLEYRGMLDQIQHPEYYEWIYELMRLKTLETEDFVREQCRIAALENRRTGIAWVGEHSDRPGSAEALRDQGIGGWIFQEVITTGSTNIPETLLGCQQKLEKTREGFLLSKRDHNQEIVKGASLSPHAYFTVARDVLTQLGNSQQPISIHVAETTHETNFTKYGQGPIAERRRSFGVPFETYDQSVVEVLNDLGVLRPGTQCVHCCDVSETDIDIFKKSGVTIAHCPRSNVRLQCPSAPVREFLDAGITVGLGMDSPASGGKIDMFDEMRAALQVSHERGKPLTAQEVWRMATSEGYQSFGPPKTSQWDIYAGSSTPLIKINLHSTSLQALIEQANPSHVEWLEHA
jgi:cytosine/adenosine deaminase-related metal-dependent hydrolase